jgi:hypothetical protein
MNVGVRRGMRRSWKNPVRITKFKVNGKIVCDQRFFLPEILEI